MNLCKLITPRKLISIYHTDSVSRSLNCKAFPIYHNSKLKGTWAISCPVMTRKKKSPNKTIALFVSILTLVTKHFEGQERNGIIFGHNSSSGGIVVILARRLLCIRALLIHITENLSDLWSMGCQWLQHLPGLAYSQHWPSFFPVGKEWWTESLFWMKNPKIL